MILCVILLMYFSVCCGNPNINVETDYDVVIIGGGISGLYTAYRLSRDTNYKIALYDKNHKLGGRMSIGKINDHLSEYGHMKFESGLQRRMMKLLYELELDTIPIKPFNRIDLLPNINNLYSDEVQIYKEYKKKSSDIPLEILFTKHALTLILEEQWDFHSARIDKDVNNREEKKKLLRKHGKFQQQYLYMFGIMDLFKKVLSEECLKFILEKGNSRYMIDKNPNAAEHISVLIDMIDSYNWDLISIKGGTIMIIHKLYKKIREHVSIHTEHQLVEIEPIKKGVTCLHFANKRKTFCKHLILTPPPLALYNIKGLPRNIYKLIKSSFVHIKLVNIYIVIENPPDITNTKHDLEKLLHCQEINFILNKPKHKGIFMLNVDENLIIKTPIESYIYNVEQILRQYFSQNLDWKISMYKINNWGDTNIYFWKAGINCEQVLNQVSSFSLYTNYQNYVHICGESLSNFQSFIEGALSSVETITEKIIS